MTHADTLDTADPRSLALRLEARWNDARAAWERLKRAEASAKDDIKARKAEIEAIQSAIDSILREDHEDIRLAFKRIQDFRAKADKRIGSLDAAAKRHKIELVKRRAALEILLSSDLVQLPLLLPDMSVVTDLHVEGQLLVVGDPVRVKGVDNVLWFVRGFRTQGEADERVEVVVLEDEVGTQIEANQADLSRSGDLGPPSPKAEDPAEDPAEIFGGDPHRGQCRPQGRGDGWAGRRLREGIEACRRRVGRVRRDRSPGEPEQSRRHEDVHRETSASGCVQAGRPGGRRGWTAGEDRRDPEAGRDDANSPRDGAGVVPGRWRAGDTSRP